jgi:predicted secreted protein
MIMKTSLSAFLLAVFLASCTNTQTASTQPKLPPVAVGPSSTTSSTAARSTPPSAAGQKTVTLTGRDRNAFVTLAPNGTLSVQLETAAGYRWKLASPLDPSVLVATPGANSLAPVALAPQGPMPPTQETWVFKAVGPGTAKVRMIYSNPARPFGEAVPFDFTVNAE